MEFENVFLFIKLNFTKNERSYLSFVIIFDEQVEVISGGEIGRNGGRERGTDRKESRRRRGAEGKRISERELKWTLKKKEHRTVGNREKKIR